MWGIGEYEIPLVKTFNHHRENALRGKSESGRTIPKNGDEPIIRLAPFPLLSS